MCGIAGILDRSEWSDGAELRSAVSTMANHLAHRGPDDSDIWCDPSYGIALGHRRLAVVDLTSAGHQPMCSHDGRFVIVYNGELYNTSAVSAAIEAARGPISWRGHSDTEVLLEAIAAWGVKAALKSIVGMFAFAVWDRRERSLVLARDRIGEKPLYYGIFGNGLLFGSELKALRVHPAWRSEVDRDALALYLRYAYIPAPYTIFRGVRKLAPGSFIQFTLDRLDVEPQPYWSAHQIAVGGVRSPAASTEAELTDQLDGLLREAVRGQMEADVPLGAFLSGGIDSSLIVALMQAESRRPVNTFTIGFQEEAFNEARHAKLIAQHLGTQHTELYVTPAEARAVIPKLPQIYCEPFADSSQIPTFLVSELTRRHVTVALSGDAGDELFGGYNRYQLAQRLWARLSFAPLPVRRRISTVLRAISPAKWDKMLTSVRPVLPTQLRLAYPGDKVHKLANIMALVTLDEVYRRLVSQWPDPTVAVPGASEPRTAVTDQEALAAFDDPLARMMYIDLVTYLPDDILVKVDRAAMSVSLETRIPLLDYRVVEFAWKLPMQFKVRNGESKYLLKRVLERYVPRHLFNRPKMGFGVPLDSWLRNELRDWAESLLSPRALTLVGAFDPTAVRKAWERHLTEKENLVAPLWCILMYQAWHQHWNQPPQLRAAA